MSRSHYALEPVGPRLKGGRRAKLPGVTPGRLFVMLAVFLVVGVPIVAVLWHNVNEVMAGQFGRLIVAIPLLIVLIAYLLVFARTVNRLER